MSTATRATGHILDTVCLFYLLSNHAMRVTTLDPIREEDD